QGVIGGKQRHEAGAPARRIDTLDLGLVFGLEQVSPAARRVGNGFEVYGKSDRTDDAPDPAAALLLVFGRYEFGALRRVFEHEAALGRLRPEDDADIRYDAFGIVLFRLIGRDHLGGRQVVVGALTIRPSVMTVHRLEPGPLHALLGHAIG